MNDVLQTKLCHWLGAAALAAVLSVTPKGCTPLPAKVMPSAAPSAEERDAAEADRLWHEFYGGMNETERMEGIVYEPVE